MVAMPPITHEDITMDATYTVWLIDDNGKDICTVSRETRHPEADIKADIVHARKVYGIEMDRNHYRIEG